MFCWYSPALLPSIGSLRSKITVPVPFSDQLPTEPEKPRAPSGPSIEPEPEPPPTMSEVIACTNASFAKPSNEVSKDAIPESAPDNLTSIDDTSPDVASISVLNALERTTSVESTPENLISIDDTSVDVAAISVLNALERATWSDEF